ncbi:hypothetical protein HPB47_001345 [Ixodes persulcatus]|uniref:Uncharacterized protein n=1 Tax=Ixodes persulcatus TaxID=34615 RepID=A0AC60PPA5_IXOPE|nr:hypothetical protein HPB47_001345 [Ixodes persulcatus]
MSPQPIDGGRSRVPPRVPSPETRHGRSRGENPSTDAVTGSAAALSIKGRQDHAAKPGTPWSFCTSDNLTGALRVWSMRRHEPSLPCPRVDESSAGAA